jgi:hypothetical protein
MILFYFGVGGALDYVSTAPIHCEERVDKQLRGAALRFVALRCGNGRGLSQSRLPVLIPH